MLKTQRFSSLFRHYAKYHGLRKDDLEYYFVNPLENEDTPESVQLQRGDTIMVRKRRKPDPPEPAADDEEFFKDMIDLLDDEEHMDAIFIINNNNHNQSSSSSLVKLPSSTNNTATTTTSNTATQMMIATSNSNSSSSSNSHNIENNNTSTGNVICVKKEDFGHQEDEEEEEEPMVEGIQLRAHKCILTARSEYFKALFRKSAGKGGNGGSSDVKLSFREAAGSVIHVDPSFAASTIQMMLEFLYTNRVRSLTSVSTDDLLQLLHLADMYALRDLKRLVEHELIRSHMDVNTVARMYCATEDYNANRLSQACIDFIMENIREVTGNVEFQEEMKHYPHLCIPVLKAAADLIPEPVHKKQRTDNNNNHSSNNNNNNNNSNNAGGCSSSPVPDSDA